MAFTWFYGCNRKREGLHSQMKAGGQAFLLAGRSHSQGRRVENRAKLKNVHGKASRHSAGCWTWKRAGRNGWKQTPIWRPNARLSTMGMHGRNGKSDRLPVFLWRDFACKPYFRRINHRAAANRCRTRTKLQLPVPKQSRLGFTDGATPRIGQAQAPLHAWRSLNRRISVERHLTGFHSAIEGLPPPQWVRGQHVAKEQRWAHHQKPPPWCSAAPDRSIYQVGSAQ